MKRRKDPPAPPPAPASGSPAIHRLTRSVWILTALVVTGAAALLWIRRQPNPSNGLPPSATVAVPKPSIRPEAPHLQDYAGSVRCRECHAEEFEAWSGSHHGLAERRPTLALDDSAFVPGRTFRHGTQATTVGRSNDTFWVTAPAGGSVPKTFPIERVIGEAPLRQFLVPFPGGRLQTLEASWDVRGRDWFNVYGTEDRMPGEWGHWTGRGMNWNSMCASCHNTRVDKDYDADTDSYRTRMAEMTVSCESCHGPLKAHDTWQRQHAASGKPDPTLTRLTPDQTLDNCGFCHARRAELTGDFKPGDRFGDCMRLTVVDHSDTFYPDGQVREEDYELSAFLGSRMHFRGVRCGDCHEPHSAKTRLPGNWLCLRCHNGSDPRAPAINPVTHSFHTVFGFNAQGVATNLDLTTYTSAVLEKSGGECINCHMPQTTYMQRHRRHDHGFTIPDPLLTREQGIPNACNRCHQDRSVDWAVEWVERWYGPRMQRPTRTRAQALARARNGEPGAHRPLLGLLATEEIPYWRAVIAGMLQPWSADPSVASALVARTDDTNALVRAAAVRSLEPALEGQPSRVAAASRLLQDPVRDVRIAAAWALRRSVDPASDAGRDLLRSLEVNADQPSGQVLLGNYQLARQDPAKALAHFRRALEWDPNSAAIHQELAVVLSSLGRNTEAIPHLERACALEPRNGQLRFLLALGWNELGQTRKAVEHLQATVELDPRHARAWYNLGLALNAVSQPDDGLAALLRAESLQPEDPGIPYARATILSGLGRAAEARQAAARALEIQPGYPPAQQFLRLQP